MAGQYDEYSALLVVALSVCAQGAGWQCVVVRSAFLNYLTCIRLHSRSCYGTCLTPVTPPVQTRVLIPVPCPVLMPVVLCCTFCCATCDGHACRAQNRLHARRARIVTSTCIGTGDERSECLSAPQYRCSPPLACRQQWQPHMLLRRLRLPCLPRTKSTCDRLRCSATPVAMFCPPCARRAPSAAHGEVLHVCVVAVRRGCHRRAAHDFLLWGVFVIQVVSVSRMRLL